MAHVLQTILTRSLLFASLCLFGGCMGNHTPTTFIVARDPTWYPYDLMGKEKNLVAFTDDLISAISDEEGIEIFLIKTTPDDLLPGLLRGNYVGILSSKTPTLLNREELLFSEPYLFLGPVLVVSADSKVTSLDEMENATVGIKSGSSFSFEIERYPAITFVTYVNILTGLDALAEKHIDGVIMPNLQANVYLRGFYQGKIKIATPPLTKEGFRLVAVQDSTGDALMLHFNHGIEELKKNGKYKALLDKWDIPL